MHTEQDYIIADSSDDFIGMEIIDIERHKTGVCIVTVRRRLDNNGVLMMRVFTKDEFVPTREIMMVPK